MSLVTVSSVGLPISNVIALINASTLVVGIVATGFTLVAIIAVWRMGKGGAAAYFRMFERLQVLQLLTVMLVIASATILALLGVLNSNGITGILSGVAGYVLGGLNTAKAAPAFKTLGPANSPISSEGVGKDLPSSVPVTSAPGNRAPSSG